MKIFYSEGRPDYSSYTFNYGIYCVKEHQNEIPRIYQQGFLPYSADLTLQHEIFYLARSLRVDLDRFVDTSENRRVDRKIAELDIHMSFFNKQELLNSEPDFLPFAQAYANRRIGSDHMTNDRLDYILRLNIGTHIFRFSREERSIGYVLTCFEQNCLHYWFSFFDLALMKSHSLGKWMMWKVINWCRKNDLAHVYLGTCYGQKSLYKVRDHKGLSFFDGQIWNTDMKLLKEWCKKDADRGWQDRFKNTADKNQFLNQL